MPLALIIGLACSLLNVGLKDSINLVGFCEQIALYKTNCFSLNEGFMQSTQYDALWLVRP